ncbi:MAG: carboxypeptidase-like regulatory domain-containing protein [Bacteroidales bacterium]|nr:carboxypeptidase-like regulatory domain-containing protein [Bacteroidales bacterium]
MKSKAIILTALVVLGLSNVALANSPAEPAAEPVANNAITGIVLDKTTGEALTGVEVRVEGTDLKTYTDFDGKFVFDGVKAGEYKVKANYISYQDCETKAIKVNRNEFHALKMQLETVNN